MALNQRVGYHFTPTVFEKRFMSEVGFEPTPTEVDCDLNAAP